MKNKDKMKSPPPPPESVFPQNPPPDDPRSLPLLMQCGEVISIHFVFGYLKFCSTVCSYWFIHPARIYVFHKLDTDYEPDAFRWFRIDKR